MNPYADPELTKAANRIYYTYGNRLDLFFHDAQHNLPWGTSAIKPQSGEARESTSSDSLASSDLLERAMKADASMEVPICPSCRSAGNMQIVSSCGKCLSCRHEADFRQFFTRSSR